MAVPVLLFPSIAPRLSLDFLPIRPPTPPREARSHGRDPRFRPGSVPTDGQPSVQTPSSLLTPDPSIGGSVGSGSCRQRKRVEWSADPAYIVEPSQTNGKFSPPVSYSSAPDKPVKGILKPTAAGEVGARSGVPTANRWHDENNLPNIAAMLESTIQQLSGVDTATRLDAYRMLSRALRTSDNLPDRAALRDSISVFTQFIQRDVSAKPAVGQASKPTQGVDSTAATTNGVLDLALVTAALELLNTFLQFPSILPAVPIDFGIFMIQYCIRAFEDEASPKVIVRYLMQVVYRQNFPTKVMTLDRVGKLLSALHTIETRVRGKSIVLSRIQIYHRLMKQCRTHMLVHSDWLIDLFTDMLSSIKELRGFAIKLGLEAGFGLGKEKLVARKTMDILQRTADDERQYVQFYLDKLTEMYKKQDGAAEVPKVWSVVLLLVRGPLDRWEYFTAFLQVIQLCFNSSDYAVKEEANLAWNRLVYLLHSDQRSFAKTRATLTGPLLSQLRRKSRGKPEEEKTLRKVVYGSIRNLFYYLFDPSTQVSQLDGHWDMTVKPILAQLTGADSGEDDRDFAVELLTELFDPSARAWSVERMADDALCRPGELPAIEAKWVRKNSVRVFEVVSPLIRAQVFQLSKRNSAVFLLWQSLVASIASAGAKEIKVSPDASVFVAEMFSLVSGLWSAGLSSPDVFDKVEGGAAGFLDGVRELIGVAIQQIGVLPFTERMLTKTATDTFAPAPLSSVSQKLCSGSPITGPVRVPVFYLFPMLSGLPPGVSDETAHAAFLSTVFQPFFQSRPTARARSELGQEMMTLLPVSATCPYGPWLLVATQVRQALETMSNSAVTPTPSSTGGSQVPLGHEFRETVRILERGLTSTLTVPEDEFVALLTAIANRATEACGDAGRALVLVEPLAKFGLDQGVLDGGPLSGLVLRLVHELVAAAAYPRDRQALEAARRVLWGTSAGASRRPAADPYDGLYKLVSTVLERLYTDAGQYDLGQQVGPLVREIRDLVGRCPRTGRWAALSALQDGVAVWIQDSEAKLSSPQDSVAAETVKLLWDEVCGLLGSTERPEEVPFASVERLLCAGFRSKHHHVINTITTTWNGAFLDKADDIRLPDELQAAIRAVQPLVLVSVPGAEGQTADESDESDESDAAQRHSFVESQDDLSAALRLPYTSTRSRRSPGRTADGPRRATLSSPGLPIGQSAVHESPPESGRSGRRRASSKATKAKLRHEDSQVVFEPAGRLVVELEGAMAVDGDEAASQLLTERQMEVRARQRENALLFPFQSSPERRPPDTGPDLQPDLKRRREEPGVVPVEATASEIGSNSNRQPKTMPTRDKTPEREAGYGYDFITSTPTPRRGQAFSLVVDGDLDPPSSPPPPRRRYARMADLMPRGWQGAGSGEAADKWDFSSPVSGSPVTGSHGQVVPSSILEERRSEVEERLGGSDSVAGMLATMGTPPQSPSLGGKKTEGDGSRSRRSRMVVGATAALPQAISTPSPLRLVRPGVGVGPGMQLSPDVFMDAPTSRQPTSPAEAAAAGHSGLSGELSFGLSEGDEVSLLRIMAHLDARPAQPQAEPEASAPPASTSDGKADDAAAAAVAVECEAADVEVRPRRRKRARSLAAPASRYSMRLRDKRQRLDLDDDDDGPSSLEPDSSNGSQEEAVPDSQAVAAAAEGPSQQDPSLPLPPPPPPPPPPPSPPPSPPPPAQLASGRILGLLAAGLGELRTASLTRDEVHAIEDLFMDVKRELYEAERRGR